ncbi:MAG: hypothetical protein LBD34_01810 [Puniceicoccales bacterium]|jgi:hypothetical protein|nr:hypothetical protein [Puniceicoccales bacterium]
MESLKRTQSAQGYDLLVTKPVEKGNSAPKVEDPIVADGKEVSIPLRKVPCVPLGTRSAEAAAVSPVVVQRQPRGKLPVSWLEFTPENIANLTEDEIIRQLCFRGNPDPSKFGTMLFLPNGFQIVFQVLELISEDRLLELIGRNATSADSFMYIFFEKEYFVDDIDESPTEETMRNSVRVECKPLPQGLSRKKAKKLITVVSREMLEVYVNEDKRREFEGKVRKIVDLIFDKLPPPNEKNQRYWDNIREAIGTVIDESYGMDYEKKLAKLKKRFPVLNLVFS